MLSTFNYIEERLNFLGFRIETRGKLNLLDLRVHMETFYLHFCNELFGWQLINLNINNQNAEAVDLVDHSSKIVIQVSAAANKQKVDSALTSVPKDFSGYSFKFISIAKDASSLRKKQFENPNGLQFDPLTDILDIPSLLRYVGSLRAEKQLRIADFLKSELRNDHVVSATEATTRRPIDAQQVKHGKISVDSNGAVIESDEQ